MVASPDLFAPCWQVRTFFSGTAVSEGHVHLQASMLSNNELCQSLYRTMSVALTQNPKPFKKWKPDLCRWLLIAPCRYTAFPLHEMLADRVMRLFLQASHQTIASTFTTPAVFEASARHHSTRTPPFNTHVQLKSCSFSFADTRQTHWLS